MKHNRNLCNEMLEDVCLAVAMAFGIVFRTPPPCVEPLRRRGVNLAERSGNLAWLLPVLAMFLGGGDAAVLRSGANVDLTRRTEPTEACMR